MEESTGYRPVLVIEDSDEDFEAITRGLRAVDPDIPVVRIDNGDEALDYLFDRDGHSEARPGLVVLDLGLPGVEGQEILALIKRDDDLHTLPVIVLTTSDAEDDVQSSYREGANAYVEKSPVPNEFANKISAMKSFWYGAVKLPPG